ncbi:MAG: ABC transporter permease [Candidatus Aminicenantaceae bacterium]
MVLKNYIKVALRNVFKRKLISFVNIFGLTVGMACAVLIFLWVQQQLSYDKDQVHRDRLYRLETETWVNMPPYLRETAAAFPEVEEAVRFYYWLEPTLKYRENIFTVTNFALVDDSVFKAFNFDFIVGQADTALASPFSIVLTESIAARLFGDANPLGQAIRMNNAYDYTVTGVVRNITELHMNINAFSAMTDMVRRDPDSDFLTSRNYNHSIYLLVSPGTDGTALADKIDQRAREVDEFGGDRLILRPFNDIYFTANLQHEKNTKHGNVGLVLGFSIIAVLILLIACINFVNLTIAQTGTREKEIAMRKVVGARKSSLQRQFFGETLVFVAIAFLLAAVLLKFLLPLFNRLTGEEIVPAASNLGFLAIVASVLLFTAFVSGAYPSFYLSVLNPVLILKGKSRKGRKNSLLSRLLITFQFTISIALIISTLTVVKQLNFMQNRDLGMDYDQMLTFSLRGEKFQGDADKQLSSKSAFKERLLSNPEVRGITYLNQVLGKITNTWTWNLAQDDDGIPLRVINSDPDFVGLMGLEVIAGRNFSYDMRTDLDLRFLINEEAARVLGFEDPIGKTTNNGRMHIIGVVKDFHYNSLHTKIEPMAISWSYWTGRAGVKISGRDIGETIRFIEDVYAEFCPGFSLEFSFLDETFAQQYEAERRLEKLLMYFVSLAICLSCLGLFALTAFVVEQKTKEIGIRKVLGSTNTGIVVLLSRSFAVWVVLANIVAWPVSYFVLDRWLQNFAYHINVSPVIFVLSGSLALLVALLTVGVQALKASSANPIDCLKYE